MMPSRGRSSLTPFRSFSRICGSSKRFISTAVLRALLPSDKYTYLLGKTYYPQITTTQITRDVKKLCHNPDASIEQLRSWFGSGRNLVAYQRIIERGQLEDRYKSSPGNVKQEEVIEAHKTIYRASLKLNNQFALGRLCVQDVIDHDLQRKERAIKLLAKLRDTNLPAAYFIIGNMYASTGKIGEAIAEFSKCIRAAKAHVDAAPKVDKEYYDYDREIDYSHMVKCHFLLGMMHEYAGDLWNARVSYLQALDLQAFSKEMLPEMEIAASNFLSVMAEWEGSTEATEHYALKSSMQANMYGLLSMSRFARRYDENPLWEHKWLETQRVQQLMDMHLKVAVMSPHMIPVATMEDKSR
ncbi:hypothetical protein POJ06DRAFT_9797 [Lipomyces tetrasporus]|uniref:Uncharacterized protein n=1 Tax=Lipomyces tetrasporus TaxID=54092 RepID=A0AAD7VWG2_9ASCO|nr:uncharacterized protein POJ06DRAFT_9797 [Lipomyces tetrasporus]KAJ8103944.1 hypothetical protein POJ06DRAFT_9797 [Lipomyces tetrasporus]